MSLRDLSFPLDTLNMKEQQMLPTDSFHLPTYDGASLQLDCYYFRFSCKQAEERSVSPSKAVYSQSLHYVPPHSLKIHK